MFRVCLLENGVIPVSLANDFQQKNTICWYVGINMGNGEKLLKKDNGLLLPYNEEIKRNMGRVNFFWMKCCRVKEIFYFCNLKMGRGSSVG